MKDVFGHEHSRKHRELSKAEIRSAKTAFIFMWVVISGLTLLMVY